MDGEVDALELALEHVPSGPTEVLADHPGRRRVVRVGGLLVKAYSAAEQGAWDREVRALTSLAGTRLAPALIKHGNRWLAIEWCPDLEAPGPDHDTEALHRSLGACLVRFHAHPPLGMGPWSIEGRLNQRLRACPPKCPTPLFRKLRDVGQAWVEAADGAVFVHGDWGSSNVLVRRGGSPEVEMIIDLEDAHVGDPAEDFRWQVLAGPHSREQRAMALGYRSAGGALGSSGRERLALFGLELCLDVLTWELGGEEEAARFHERCLTTLEELASGQLPEEP